MSWITRQPLPCLIEVFKSDIRGPFDFPDLAKPCIFLFQDILRCGCGYGATGRTRALLGRLPQFGNMVSGVYKPVRAKHSRFLPVQDSLAIVAASEFSRYKDGTRSTCALVFLKGSHGTCRATAAR